MCDALHPESAEPCIMPGLHPTHYLPGGKMGWPNEHFREPRKSIHDIDLSGLREERVGPYKRQAKARATDPATSHAAIPSSVKARQDRSDLLMVLREMREGIDEQILKRYKEESKSGRVKEQTPSGLRTRRGELVQMGLVRDSGRTAKTNHRRSAIVWEVV